ncbi:MAG: ABC transporter permease [Saprospiraceae bacterium]|nr:ABC transporter permease [Saprospiraceae bacterium]
MLLSLKIAYRYLTGKKSSQAIHWITGISIFGIAVGSAALLLVLTVFNGFDELVSGMFSKHNPDIKIVARQSKYFKEDTLFIQKLEKQEFIESFSRTIEEVCMFQYGDAQEFGIIKGVDSNYVQVSKVSDGIVEGNFLIREANRPLANIGSVLRNKLGVSVRDFQQPVRIFLPDPKESQFQNDGYQDFLLQVQSVFSFHQESDYNTLITDLDYLRAQLNNSMHLSSIDIKLKSGTDGSMSVQQLEALAGPDYIIKDRYRQDEAFLKIMKLEKWLYYSLFSLTMLLVSFTIIGALWMIVLDKRFDISILKSLGMEDRAAQNIFILLGSLICVLGLLIGFTFAIGFYWLQKQYGLIGVPSEFVIDSYPMQMRWIDFVIVIATVMAIGLLASIMPSQKVASIKPVFHEE